MKKIPVLLASLTICACSWGQNSKVTSTKMHLDSYASEKDTTELLAAKEAIDEAAVNDKTKDEPKMYLYRGETYLTYFNYRFNKLFSRFLIADNRDTLKAQADAYTAMDTNTICVAANSFIKVIQLAPTDYYAQEAKQPFNLSVTCLIHLENKALRERIANRYASALALYKKAILIDSVLGKPEDSKRNVAMAAATAKDMGNTKVALAYYQELINLKYQEATPYYQVADMYLKKNDSAKAWDFIEKGRAQYPNDLNLIIVETNFYIEKHNYEKAQNNLLLSIQKVEQSPDRDKNKNLLSSLYINLGQIYDNRANPAKGIPRPADYDSLVAKADTNYKKALALTPNDMDALYLTGALYFKEAEPLIDQANALPLNATDKYNKLMDEAKAYFLKAQPYFEKAYKINPGDIDNVNALKQVYANTGQTDKIKALNKQ